MFDADVACVFQRMVSEAGSLKVTAVVSTEERRHRPHGEESALLLRLSQVYSGPAGGRDLFNLYTILCTSPASGALR